MGTINFVPNDYVEQRQSSRANILYLMLLMAMLGAIAMTFGFIKMRQRTVQNEVLEINARMNQAHEQIAKLEQLKTKGQTMLKTMVMTAELIEPIPRSIILASLTNSMPQGVSLLQFELVEKETRTAAARPTNQYQAKAAASDTEEPTVKTETHIELMGIAPSDIEVAAYIARLSTSMLIDQVELVESKERVIDDIRYREFKLRTMLKPDLTLTKDDIDTIRIQRREAALL